MTHSNEMSDFLNALPGPVKKRNKGNTSTAWRPRYELAYQKNFEKEYPAAYEAEGYIKTSFPDVSKANGLTQAIIKYLMWCGHNADRTGTQGRMVKSAGSWKRISAGNRRGTSDISSTIKGRSAKIEIKIGNDKPSEEQLREQLREQKAGGVYIFISTMEQFFSWYDNFLISL
jgi:hypothetical protein